MLRKCGLFALSFAVLSTSLSVFFSDVSSAASEYDDYYGEVDTVRVSSSNYYGHNCSPIDLTSNWATTVYENTEYPALGESLQSAINGSGRWGVSQYRQYQASSENYVEMVLVYWTEDDSLFLEWNQSIGAVTARGGSGQFKSIMIVQSPPYSGTGSCDTLRFYNNGNSAQISDKWYPQGYGGYQSLFVYVDADKLNIPENYEGDIPRDSTVDTREVIKPDFRYTVVDKNIKTQDHNVDLPTFEPEQNPEYPDILYYNKDFAIEWVLHKCTGDEEFTNCESENLETLDVLPQATQFEYDVNTYGKYELRASYQIEQCMRYPSYPATPDECYYADLTQVPELQNYRFMETVVTLDIDGTTIIGDTKLDDCDEYGYCVKKEQSALLDYFQGREDFGLTALLLSPLLFYQQLPSMANSCTPLTYQFLDETLEIPCMMPMYQSWSPFIVGLYQSVISAVVAYAVGLGLFRTIKNINDPEDDRIEVKQL